MRIKPPSPPAKRARRLRVLRTTRGLDIFGRAVRFVCGALVGAVGLGPWLFERCLRSYNPSFDEIDRYWSYPFFAGALLGGLIAAFLPTHDTLKDR